MNSHAIVAALSVSPQEQDHESIQQVFDGSKWSLYRADCIASALSLLRKRPVGAVLCEGKLPPDTWIELLERLRLFANPPPLIVTSRLADDSLWAEALNLGAYDVLAKPFDRQELLRTVKAAWLHWHHSRDIPARRPTELMTAAG
jgi:DNA-binding response OmpR family regulator